MNDDFYPDGRPLSKEEIILNNVSSKTMKLVYKDNMIPDGKIIGFLKGKCK